MPAAKPKPDWPDGNGGAIKETPLMRQYNAIKAQHPGALLLFRVGDFYETFGEDAVRASQALAITLTKRANGAASEIALAGFPHHALDAYLPKLVRAGFRVAICDQLEDPKTAIGVVKRGVTELVTPGVTLSDATLEQGRNRYLCAICFTDRTVGLAFADVSTGEFSCAQGDLAFAQKLLESMAPAEVLASKAVRHTLEDTIGPVAAPYFLDDWIFADQYGYDQVRRHFGVATLKGFGVEHMPAGVAAAGAILHYLAETEHRQLGHIVALSRIDEAGHVWLDRFTIRNLEILDCQQEGGTPLVSVLDKTSSPMGARMLRRWLVLPLTDEARIRTRHEAVAYLLAHVDEADALARKIGSLGDLERLAGKLATGRITPREMGQLRRALEIVSELKESTALPQNAALSLHRLTPLPTLTHRIAATLSPDAPAQANQLGIIAPGVSPELDRLRQIAFSGKELLLDIQKREAAGTGISSLKVAYNKVFGYYLEVTHAHRDKVPAEWIRKQTLVGAERYITPELKEYEEQIQTAESRMAAIEYQLWQELVAEAATYVEVILANARVCAELDCLGSFAEAARLYNYCRPSLTEARVLDIAKGRHPVIERQLPPGEAYVPNSLRLDEDERQILIITGPNMSGKSALLRQTALICLMAQCGSFVPAEAATLGLVDKIFTRVGASDNLSRGESTFMVEMTETASILNNLSDRSLVIMDEIGRGTSTYDGISIAWAIVEHLHNHPRFRPKTLFATHYHELGELAATLPRVHNANVAVREAGDRVIFLRTLEPGPAAHSFGIHVAQMAGMPVEVVGRADEVLRHLETEKAGNKLQARVKKVPKPVQLSLFGAENPEAELAWRALQDLDINSLSPIQALMKIVELRGMRV